MVRFLLLREERIARPLVPVLGDMDCRKIAGLGDGANEPPVLGLTLWSNYGPATVPKCSNNAFGSHPCRVVSVSYRQNGCCNGRARGFESRRPRQFFQALARNWQIRSWSNLVQSGQSGCLPFIVGEANTQSVSRLYGAVSLSLSRDSAKAASSGTSFAEASVLGAPWTISRLNGEHGSRGSRSPHPPIEARSILHGASR